MHGRIVRLQLDRIKQRVAQRYKVPFDVDDDVVELVVSRCNESESGGRMIDNILTHTLLPDMSGELLTRTMQGRAVQRVRVRTGNGDLVCGFD